MTKVIDATYTIDSDKYNWILREKRAGKKVKLHFFPSIKHLARFIGDCKLREFLVKGEVGKLDKSAETPSYASVIEESARRFEQYVDSLVSQENSKR